MPKTEPRRQTVRKKSIILKTYTLAEVTLAKKLIAETLKNGCIKIFAPVAPHLTGMGYICEVLVINSSLFTKFNLVENSNSLTMF